MARQNSGAGGLFADSARQRSAESAAAPADASTPTTESDRPTARARQAGAGREATGQSNPAEDGSVESAQDVRVERTPVQARQAGPALKSTLPADSAGRADYAGQETPEQSGAVISAHGFLGALASSAPGVTIANMNKASIAPAQSAAPVASGAPRTAFNPQQSASARLYKPPTNRTLTTSQETLAAQAERAFASLLNTKGGEVRFRLDPAELGTLHVSMQITGQSVSVRFGTSSPLAHGLLERTRERLRTAMESRGLSVERIEIVSEGEEAVARIDLASGGGDRPGAPGPHVSQSPDSGKDAADTTASDARGDRRVRLLDAAA